ncbi:MAG: PD40 domain-containing protein [Anaerolineales bacterium]|nr:PD40 domain-containing protein [Anaerolineales bacterium]
MGRRLRAVPRTIWQFFGRVGLAIRRLLFLLIWRPFLFLTAPFRFVGRHSWRLLGRMGAALRVVLTYTIWWPLLLLLYPVSLIYEKLLMRLLDWLGILLYRLVAWFSGLVWPPLHAFIQARWQATAPQRQLWRRHWGSRWLVQRARLRLLWRRHKPPQTAVFVPHIPTPPNVRRWRLVTAVITATAIFLVGFFTFQERGQPVSAEFIPQIVVLTPTPEPTLRVTPTQTPTPRPTPWPTPDPLTEGGSLAFTLHANGNSDIYLLPVGKAEPLRLTSHPAEDREPAWSPDGREIAFSSRRSGDWEIYVYNLPYGQLRQITNSAGFDGNPAWSPDGQWLVYESYRNQNMDIYIMRANGSDGPYRLTENPALDYDPSWAPDGRHIAFISWRGGNPDIFMLSLDQVSDTTAVNITNAPDAQEANPAFSPNGRFLAYYDDSSGFPLLSALPLDDNANVTGSPQTLGQQGFQPAWSPNSESLVYVYDKGERSFLMAGSPNAWGVAPQTFATEGKLGSPSWSAVTIPLDVIDNWQSIDTGFDNNVLYVEALAAAETAVGAGTPTPTPGPAVQLWQVPVNAPSPYLSDKVDQSFLALRDRVVELAGWDYLSQFDNMFVRLDSQPLPGEAAENWNKAGRAFDLPYRDATTFDPQVEVVREDIGTETYWRIYIRAAAQDGSMGEPLRDIPWDFRARFGDEPRYYNEGGKLKDAIPAGYYLDFTALAADYGWQRVPASDNWRTFFPGIRFWHYENRGSLTWAEAMREIYRPNELGEE